MKVKNWLHDNFVKEEILSKEEREDIVKMMKLWLWPRGSADYDGDQYPYYHLPIYSNEHIIKEQEWIILDV